MAGERCSTGAVVLILMIAFHGDKLAFGETATLQDWEEVYRLYAELATNGMGPNQTDGKCKSNMHLEKMEILAESTAQGMLDSGKGVQDFKDALGPDQLKQVCAVKKNLVCYVDDCFSCITQKKRDMERFCDGPVKKILANLGGSEEPSTGGGTDKTEDKTGGKNGTKVDGGSTKDNKTDTDKSGVVGTACGSSCRVLIITGTLAISTRI